MTKQKGTNNKHVAETNSSGEEKNGHQDLSRENIGFEKEETERGNPDSPYKLKHSLDDKRPEDNTIEKGWAIDSDTSRGPQDMEEDASD